MPMRFKRDLDRASTAHSLACFRSLPSGDGRMSVPGKRVLTEAILVGMVAAAAWFLGISYVLTD
jgi:hypothetical protein